MNRLILLILLVMLIVNANAANDIILSNKAGTSLNPVQIFKDSTSDHPTGIAYLAGHLFEIIGETVNEYEDDAQNQKFKWYHVKTPKGGTGWIYGDGLAVVVNENTISPALKEIHQERFNFDNGFENAMVWVAEISGRDNFHQQDYLNPPYSERYLVVTNEEGRSAHINIGGVNARGDYGVESLELADATGDGIADFILTTKSNSVEKKISNTNLTIHSFQSGSLKKVFEERLNLLYDDTELSPAISKYVEIGTNTIRVAYPEYLSCSDENLPYTVEAMNVKMERCMSYVTYTFKWNERTNQFEMLYDISRTPLMGKAKEVGRAILEKPTIVAKRLAVIPEYTPVKVIKHYEKLVKVGQQKQLVVYLMVELPGGLQGYVLSDQIDFVETEHASLFSKYYRKPVLDKSKWNSSQSFVVIKPTVDTSMSKK